jgi:hypothetical protein
MPIASLLLEDCPEVYSYKIGLENKLLPMKTYLLKTEKSCLILIVVYPIMYIFEWAIFNPFFRWMMKRGLYKVGYSKERIIRPINRLELIGYLLK